MRPFARAGAFLTGVVILSAALVEGWMIGRGPCPVHSDVCDIESPFPFHTLEGQPIIGPVAAPPVTITPGTGALTLTGFAPVVA